MRKFIYPIILIILFAGAYYLYKKYMIAPELDFSKIELQTQEGKNIKLSDYLGEKNIILCFWASWCKPCIQEMPSLQRALETLGEDKFEVLAVSDESLETIDQYNEQFPYHFEFLKFNGNIKDMKILSLPTTYVINKKGKIIMQKVGAQPWDTDSMIGEINDLTKD